MQIEKLVDLTQGLVESLERRRLKGKTVCVKLKPTNFEVGFLTYKSL